MISISNKTVSYISKIEDIAREAGLKDEDLHYIYEVSSQKNSYQQMAV